MNSGEKVITAFAVGIGLGAVLGVLFAPAKGSVTRSRIKEEVDDYYHKAADAVNKLKEKAEEMKHRAGDYITEKEEEYYDRANKAINKLKNKADELKHKADTYVEDEA